MYPIEHMYGRGFGIGIGELVIGGILTLLVFAAMLALIYLAARAYGQRRHPDSSAGPAPDSALAILNIRYAKGEIDKETYDRMRKDIS